MPRADQARTGFAHSGKHVCRIPILAMLRNLPFASADLLHGGTTTMSDKLSDKVFASADQALGHGGEKVPILEHLIWYSVNL